MICFVLRPISYIWRKGSRNIYNIWRSHTQGKERELEGGMSWRKYTYIDKSLSYARRVLGVNYFLEPATKEYIQKYKKTQDVKTILPGLYAGEEGPSWIPTYQEVLKNGENPLNKEYIRIKVKEKHD